MNKLEGKNGITVEVVQHSKDSATGKEIITFGLKYGLYIQAEHLRHRSNSFTVKSNRAIPAKKIRKEVLQNPYVPVKLGANQSGMQASTEVAHKGLAKALWKAARYPACFAHWIGERVLGLHKEVVNRLLIPWQYVEMCVTATEMDNFYNLRIHPDAQGDIEEFAQLMHTLNQESTPLIISHGEWHVPYVERKHDGSGVLRYYDNDGTELNVEEAKKASAARCARASYNNHNSSKALLERDKGLYDMLVGSEPLHASPTESQATPMAVSKVSFGSPSVKKAMAQQGVTHADTEGNLWSANFQGFIQARQLLNNHTCWDYERQR